MWQQVKSDNPGLSVCEIGSTIGRMWRELSTEDKQKHNDDFTLDKVCFPKMQVHTFNQLALGTFGDFKVSSHDLYNFPTKG